MLKIFALAASLTLCCSLAGQASAHTVAPALGVSVQVRRESLDLLGSLAIEVVVRNPSSAPLTATFAGPTEYAIEVWHGRTRLWSSAPEHPPVVTTHRRAFAPGATALVVYDWNALAAGGFSPNPGTYRVRVRLLDSAPVDATAAIRFAPPYPVAGLAQLPPGRVVTIGGRLNAAHTAIADATGRIALARGIPSAPTDRAVVLRGYTMHAIGGALRFVVRRWAPLGVPPPATPQPAPTSSR